ncbi:MAG: hypothetical protein WKG01_13450 [Kofleriaceae bacterium]
MSLDPLPQARVVKKAGQLMAPPRAPRTQPPSAAIRHARDALNIALGLWPLTGVVLLMFFLLIVGANAGAP